MRKQSDLCLYNYNIEDLTKRAIGLNDVDLAEALRLMAHQEENNAFLECFYNNIDILTNKEDPGNRRGIDEFVHCAIIFVHFLTALPGLRS